MSDNIEIFKGKTFQDLTKDIYDNASKKKKQIDLLVQQIHGFIKKIDDVIIVAPIIKEYMEVSVKNDEHLVKLASVLQKIITKSTADGDDSQILSDAEKEELIATLNETVGEIQVEADKVNNIKDKQRANN